MLLLSCLLRKFDVPHYFKHAYTSWLLLACVLSIVWSRQEAREVGDLNTNMDLFIYFGMAYVVLTVRIALVLLLQSLNTVTCAIVSFAYLGYSTFVLIET